MPELPEVETIAREMRDSDLVGMRIIRAVIAWPKTIEGLSSGAFSQKIANQKIKDVSRRGKYLIISLNRSQLLVHLRMTGKFSIINNAQKPHSHERVRLIFADGRALCYEDQRKFGRWQLVDDSAEALAHLGLEPLSSEFTWEAFLAMLKKHSGQIKPFLLNQEHIAGLGNIYVDEALWEAKIHPQQLLSTLNENTMKALYHAIPNVLMRGLANKGTSLGDHRANYQSMRGARGKNQSELRVFHREGCPCVRCGTTIVKIVVVQRGTHFCPHCQKI